MWQPQHGHLLVQIDQPPAVEAGIELPDSAKRSMMPTTGIVVMTAPSDMDWLDRRVMWQPFAGSFVDVGEIEHKVIEIAEVVLFDDPAARTVRNEDRIDMSNFLISPDEQEQEDG